ncbi:DNA replication/repair protein RecF [Caldithrix abyssi]
MKLINLQVKNFRNIKQLTLNITKNINIIYGGNAQGKTSILEAIYLLGITKSFRVNDDRSIVNSGNEFYEVRGTFRKNLKNTFNIRLFFSINEGKHLFWEQKKVKTFSEMIGKVPVILLSLEDLELTYGSPSFRRKFIDILISQIDPLYLQALKQLIRILKNRNKLLSMIKEGGQKEEALIPWNLQLAEHASYVCLKRHEIIEEINPLIYHFYKNVSGRNEKIEIKYKSFFDAAALKEKEVMKTLYLKKLNEVKERDINYTTTTIGPHRDDLIFFKDDALIKIFGSQGENKTFLISLKFAEAVLMEKIIDEKPILLLDDIFSELDLTRIQKVVENIQHLQFQTFITTTNAEKFDSGLSDVGLWHVQNGQVHYEA